MSFYNIIAQTTESTVVTEYKSSTTRSDAYQSEAELFGNKDIPPLKQTLDEVLEEFDSGTILKMTGDDGIIIGSVRAHESGGTVYIGKLMVHPDCRRRGCGKRCTKVAAIVNFYKRVSHGQKSLRNASFFSSNDK